MPTSVFPVDGISALGSQRIGTIPLRSPGLEDLLALVGLSSRRRSTSELSGAAEEIIRGISTFVEGLLLKGITTRTRREFIVAREEVFGQYAEAVSSLAKLVRIVVPDPVTEHILDESFCAMESEFRESGATRFGTAARDQAMFTIWTLRRTSALISKIAKSGPAPENVKDRDICLAAQFSFYALWAQFHLDCLVTSLRAEKTVQLDIMPEIIDGLRAAVDAYGYGREGLHLRTVEPQPSLSSYPWDEEDQALLEASMREMRLENIEWRRNASVPQTVKFDSQLKLSTATKQNQAEPYSESPLFGTHIREGIEIVKDWIESRKQ